MTIYQAKYVFPVSSPPIENGGLAVDQERIVAVGRARDLGLGRLVDLGNQVLLPGFVNAHTHLELSLLRGRIPPQPFLQWLRQLPPPNRSSRDEESVQGVRLGLAECLASGVSCVGDICATGPYLALRRASPLRSVCFLELISGAKRPPRNPVEYREWLDRETKAAKTKPLHTMVGISPHALYSVLPEHAAALVALAAERSLPLAIHLLEIAAEREWLEFGTGELAEFLESIDHITAKARTLGPAMKRLDLAGVLRRRPLLAHVNYVTDDEIDQLARCGASVAYCPRAHHYFGHSPHRWQEMLRRGLNTCVGTDSLASNKTLSVLDELRFLKKENPMVEAAQLLRMGTLNGAAALGLERHIGSLEVGKLADFVTVPIEEPGRGDLAEAIIEGTQPPSGLWIGGRAVGE